MEVLWLIPARIDLFPVTADFYDLSGARGPTKEARSAEFAYNEAPAEQLFDRLQECSSPAATGGLRVPSRGPTVHQLWAN